MTKNHETIWLEPECADCDCNRQWCQDNVWEACPECGLEPVKYVRADIYERAKEVIAWANNSLYGSHGFFLSTNGGPDDVHHLDRPIESLKTASRKAYRLEEENKRLHELLSAPITYNLYMEGPKYSGVNASEAARSVRAYYEEFKKDK